jgi:hypothetical protein
VFIACQVRVPPGILTEIVSGLLQSVQANSGIVPSFRLRPLFATSFISYHSVVLRGFLFIVDIPSCRMNYIQDSY